ncbi:MAG TPA: thioesterase family protein [Candidatus Avirikenella pullistercoris]|nr:thioesterase family protein [Candidatus Avirikenella pullistercoris]
MDKLKEGLSHISVQEVTVALSAAECGSGDLPVLATPAMVALMENAAMNAVAPFLSEGLSTVGVEINSSHVRATPVGDTIQATAVLKKIDGRKLFFEIEASDSKGVIGTASHVRFVVDKERFMSKLK